MSDFHTVVYSDLIEQYRARADRAESDLAQLRADLQAAQERSGAQAAIIKEQEQDIANIAAREAAVVENYRRANIEQARQLDEARELILSLDSFIRQSDVSTHPALCENIRAWLAANPAPQEQQP